MDNFTAMNEVYKSLFIENYPTRSAVEVARLPKDALVEIEVVAIIETKLAECDICNYYSG